jgi:hypothetical protein
LNKEVGRRFDLCSASRFCGGEGGSRSAASANLASSSPSNTKVDTAARTVTYKRLSSWSKDVRGIRVRKRKHGRRASKVVHMREEEKE